MYPCAQINTLIRGPCRVWVKRRCNAEKTNICPSLQSHFQAVIIRTLSAFTDQYRLICRAAQALQGFDCEKPHGRTPVPALSATAIKCEELNVALFPRLPRSDLILDSEGTVLFGLPTVLQTVPQRQTKHYFPKRLWCAQLWLFISRTNVSWTENIWSFGQLRLNQSFFSFSFFLFYKLKWSFSHSRPWSIAT